jgi:hypothetical protein
MGERTKKISEVIADVGELIAAGGLGRAARSRHKDQESMSIMAPLEVMRLPGVRAEFIENNYSRWFGTEEMGDPAAEVTPEQLTGILFQYEDHLAQNGLLKGHEPDIKY